MLFNSYEFIFAFLPITLIGFVIISRLSVEKAIGWLVITSLFFYGWWNPSYLILIISSMIFNYYIGNIIYSVNSVNKPLAKGLLTLAVLANLMLLGYYKYANFFLENAANVLNFEYEFKDIILPLAISFFTFQQIAFLIDSYRGITKEYKFLHYALFVTFFPQLIAGPIVHHKEMLPQFIDRMSLKLKSSNIAIGLAIFFIGLFKKAVLADGVAVYATPIFELANSGVRIDFFQAWGGALSYTFQLYFDFSGYSDMAIGTARLFGIKLPLNFHSPYKALNIVEFWRRWHITLSRFLKDYVYIPLGGNRKGNVRRYVNLFSTMLLGGLWHGAGWTFVIWGALHGSYLVINHCWHFIVGRFNLHFLDRSQTWRFFCWLLTFLAVVVGWVFFRANSFETASVILQGMLGVNGITIPNAIFARLGGAGDILTWLGIGSYLGGGVVFIMRNIWILCLLSVVLFCPNTQQIMDKFEPSFNVLIDTVKTTFMPNNILMRRIKFSYSYKWAVTLAFISTFGILALSQISEFLYFQF